ncbi:hypothetical protein BKN47_11495 [Pseudomonas aeruginosa]|nr:hypothetical protein BKN47_11495 [Pseudomonas aeruginosa]
MRIREQARGLLTNEVYERFGDLRIPQLLENIRQQVIAPNPPRTGKDDDHLFCGYESVPGYVRPECPPALSRQESFPCVGLSLLISTGPLQVEDNSTCLALISIPGSQSTMGVPTSLRSDHLLKTGTHCFVHFESITIMPT